MPNLDLNGVFQDLVVLTIAFGGGWLFTTVKGLKKGMDCVFPRLRAVEEELGIGPDKKKPKTRTRQQDC